MIRFGSPLLALPVLLAACTRSPGPAVSQTFPIATPGPSADVGVCSPDAWCWMQPTLVGTGLYGAAVLSTVLVLLFMFLRPAGIVASARKSLPT